MSLVIRPPPSRNASDSDSSSGFRKPAVPQRMGSGGPKSNPSRPNGGSKLKRAFSAHDDSSDEGDDDNEDRREVVTDYDQQEIERRRKRKEAPMVIAPLPNRDWRAVANARRAMSQQHFPQTGADGSVGGLGTRDAMNSTPMAAGLIKREPRDAVLPASTPTPQDDQEEESKVKQEEEVEDEDARARRLLIAELSSDGTVDKPVIEAITSLGNDWMLTRTPQNETEAYQMDVQTRPDSASLDAYERVPIEQFGAAMLRGMGWSSSAATNVEPYLPSLRPALLGIGAKERPVEDVPLAPGAKLRKRGKPDMKYMPLVKKERESTSGSSSRVASRSASPTRASSRRSPSPDRARSSRRDHDDSREHSSHDSDSKRDKDRDRRRDRDYDDRRDRDRPRDDRRYGRDDRRSDRDHDPRNGDRDRDDSRRRRDAPDSDHDRSSRRDRRD